MPVRCGRIVLTRPGPKPYMVILEHHPTGTSEHPVSTIREGEALIRDRVVVADVQLQTVEWHI